MAETNLKSAWAKIDRAKHHLQQLRLEMGGNRQSTGASFYDDLDARQHVFSYRKPTDLWLRYGVLAGEIISQARTALEHAVWEMLPDPENQTRRAGFPVFREKGGYERDGIPMIEGINDRAIAVIERAQLFNQKGGAFCYLQTIHDMWNQDKHRTLNLVLADFGGIVRNYLRGNRFIPEFTGLPGKLEDGAEFRIDFPDFYDPREMHMEAQLMLRLEFEAVPGYAFETLLTDLVGFSERTLAELSDTLP